MVSEVSVDLGINLTPYYWMIWIAGGIMILSGLVPWILRMFGIVKEDEEETPEDLYDEYVVEDDSEDFEERVAKESFHRKPKLKTETKLPKSEMTEEDFNRSEFD